MAKNMGRLAAGAAVIGLGFVARLLSRSSNRAKTEDSAGETSTDSDSVEEDPGMATLGEVEEAIQQVEGVDVVFVHPGSNRNARSNKRGFVPYPYQKKFNGNRTVNDFIDSRLRDLYEHHGLKITVQYSDGTTALGHTRLSTVREAL